MKRITKVDFLLYHKNEAKRKREIKMDGRTKLDIETRKMFLEITHDYEYESLEQRRKVIDIANEKCGIFFKNKAEIKYN